MKEDATTRYRRNLREHDQSRRDTLSKYLYNLSQICFTAMVVGCTVAFFTSTTIEPLTYVGLLLLGVASTFFLAYMANNILKKY